MDAAVCGAVVLIDASQRERLSRDSLAYEAFLDREVSTLERAYQNGTPPEVISYAASSVYNAVVDIRDAPSAERARLRGLIGQMLVARGGNVVVMDQAEVHLVAAIEELCAFGDWTRRNLTLFVELVLNHAVTLKARGTPADAAQLLRSTIGDRAMAPYWARGDRLPLLRQDVIMAGGIKPHQWLAEQNDAIRAAGHLEQYRTVKRIFEFVMNLGDSRAATKLLPAAIAAFRPIAWEVPQLARVSFIKNLGQYEALAGNPRRARGLLSIAQTSAEEHRLHGQLRQIRGLATLIDSGEQPLLSTYVASA